MNTLKTIGRGINDVADALANLIAFLFSMLCSLAGLVVLILIVHFFALWAHPFAG